MAIVPSSDDPITFEDPLNEDELAAIYNSVDALMERLPDGLFLRLQPAVEVVVRKVTGGTLPPDLVLEDHRDRERRPTYTWKEPAAGTDADCAIFYAAQTAMEETSRDINPDEYYPQSLLSIVEEQLETLWMQAIRAALSEAGLPTYDARFEALLPEVERPSVHAKLPVDGSDSTERYTGLIRGVFGGVYAGISEVISE